MEWVIAGARVVLAVGGLFAIWIDPSTPSRYEAATYTLLTMYLIHSVATLLLVWRPREFSPGWGMAGHVFDLAAFSVILSLTEGASSPFYIYFVFSVICGALRWDARGALLTAAVALALYATISGFEFFRNPAFQVDRFIIRIAHLSVVAALLAYLGSYYPRLLREVLGFASWSQVLPHDESEVVNDIIVRASEVLPAPRILLIWRESDEDYVNAAWRAETGLEWVREPRNAYEPLVIEALRNASFQAQDVSDPAGRIDYWHKGRFRDLTGAPINDALRARFNMRAVQSARIEGSVVAGRLFWLDRERMRIDDLVVGDLVARLAASRLESAYLVSSLRETAALNERLRVARDLHDSVLQSLAGTALQLAVTARLLDRDPRAAKRGLQVVQTQLEQSEDEMRALIRRLRPQPREAAGTDHQPAAPRLEAFRRRIEEQWKTPIQLKLTPAIEELPSEVRDQLVLLVQEAVLNAARHARASAIHASVDAAGREVRIEVADNGKGFPFAGSYDLDALTALNTGPLTLKERVAELQGNLHLRTGPTGSTVRITLPLPQTIHADAHLTGAR